MTEKISEIRALELIDDTLAKLSEEEVSRIFLFVSSKYKINWQTNYWGSSNSNTHLNQPNNSADIKGFLAMKKPEGFYEQISCLWYFLEKHSGLDGFGTKEIDKANKDARVTKIPNTSMYLWDTSTKYGFLTSIGKGKKAMSTRGEALVEALPNREAVAKALEDNPLKKKSAHKKKVTKK